MSETLWVRILLSTEEDNLSPFDSKIACLCQSIEINNNKHVYRQSQVRMPNGCGVKWAECSLIIGTGCRVQVLAWFSITQSVCQQAFSLLANRSLRASGFESCFQQRKTTCLLSIRKSLACARASKLTTTKMYVCMYVWQWGQVGWMLADHRDGLSSSSFFSLILDSSVGLSASIQSAGDLVSGAPGSNPAFSRGTQLVSFRFEYRLPVPEHRT